MRASPSALALVVVVGSHAFGVVASEGQVMASKDDLGILEGLLGSSEGRDSACAANPVWRAAASLVKASVVRE